MVAYMKLLSSRPEVIDGKRKGSVNHTAHAEDGWLEVELAKSTSVESFAIFNMWGCGRNSFKWGCRYRYSIGIERWI